MKREDAERSLGFDAVVNDINVIIVRIEERIVTCGDLTLWHSSAKEEIVFGAHTSPYNKTESIQ